MRTILLRALKRCPYRHIGEEFYANPVESKALVALGRAEYADKQTYQTRTVAPADSVKKAISPDAAKLAKESGIDVSTVSGTGAHGRILKRDVQALIAAS